MFEDHNLKVVGTMRRHMVPPIQNEKAHIDWVGRSEGPYVEALPADLPVDERIGAFPGSVGFCSHSHCLVESDYMPRQRASQAISAAGFAIRRDQKANFKPSCTTLDW